MIDYIIVENLLPDSLISYIFETLKKYEFQSSKVGMRVDPKQKIRQDCFLSRIDCAPVDTFIFNAVDGLAKEKFDIAIQYRERWKIGFYDGQNKSHYNPHTDIQGEMEHRKLSFVIALSAPEAYEGGELYFPTLDREFKLKKGACIIFKPELLHGVKPVISGKRYTLLSFMFDEDGGKKKLQSTDSLKQYIPNLLSQESEKSINKPNYDLDYSDRKQKPWSDTDNHWYIDQDSDTLLVSFAGFGDKNSIPTFVFHNFLQQYTQVDQLFIRDIQCRYYLDGIKNETKTMQETLAWLEGLIGQKKYKKIVGIGCSSGGYAVILFGHLLKFDKVISFAPQTVLNETKNSVLHDNRFDNTCRYLNQLKTNTDFTFGEFSFHDCLDLKNLQPYATQVEIHYPAHACDGADRRHAEYLECETCLLVEYPSKNHRIALELRDNGQLQQIIDNLVFG
ncbi:2OG-Fe(II) oxygenase [Synechocystis sp. FACHB-383]|uniref:2OG-Fe(II) oxygenase n=1 Tax=Synechocystis sp. FACHB-383 TaxID=2692864 RepID=UPI0016830612|nr:2OG-Fe(II) oxygenase [Synechocystis sp. FACHB-383]MBD2653770.1 2OG-Fe(II) oxygenase [Synechocystis sp. FACHB-383]